MGIRVDIIFITTFPLTTKKKGIMSLQDLGPVILGDIDGQITWFQAKDVLSQDM